MPLEHPGAETDPSTDSAGLSDGDVRRGEGAPFAGWDLVHHDWTLRQREPMAPGVRVAAWLRSAALRIRAALPGARARRPLVSSAVAGPGTAQSSAPPSSSRGC